MYLHHKQVVKGSIECQSSRTYQGMIVKEFSVLLNKEAEEPFPIHYSIYKS